MRGNKKVKFHPVNQTGVLNLTHFERQSGLDEGFLTKSVSFGLPRFPKSKQFHEERSEVSKSFNDDQPGTSKSFNIIVPKISCDKISWGAGKPKSHPTVESSNFPSIQNVTGKKVRRRKGTGSKIVSSESNSPTESESSTKVRRVPGSNLSSKQLKYEREEKWKARKDQKSMELKMNPSPLETKSESNQVKSEASSDDNSLIGIEEGKGKDATLHQMDYESPIDSEKEQDSNEESGTSSQISEKRLEEKDMARIVDAETQTCEIHQKCSTNSNVETQTDRTDEQEESFVDRIKAQLNSTDSSSSSILRQDSAEGSKKAQIHEDSRQPKPKIAYTEMSTMKIGNQWKFNLLGAFFNFEGMDEPGVKKVQQMLMQTDYKICDRARALYKLKNLQKQLRA